MNRAARHQFPGKVVKLTRRGRSQARAEVIAARIEADTETAVSDLLETQAPEHWAAVLRAVHKVATRQLAKIEGAYPVASFLGAEAYRLCPAMPEPVANPEIEAVFGPKAVGGARG